MRVPEYGLHGLLKEKPEDDSWDRADDDSDEKSHLLLLDRLAEDPPERRHGELPEVFPEIHDDRKDGTELEDSVYSERIRTRGTEELVRDDEVSGRGNRNEFCEAFYKAENAVYEEIMHIRDVLLS